MLGRFVLAAVALAAAPRCQKSNPDFVPAGTGGGSGSGVSGQGGSDASMNTAEDATTGAGGNSAGGTTAGVTATAGGSTTAGGTTGGAGTAGDGGTPTGTGAGSSSGGSGVAVGLSCADDMECDPATEATCCVVNQCEGRCFVPCSGGGDCDAEMTCAHGHCLFRCDNDMDCAQWPGLTCKHGGTLCEL